MPNYLVGPARTYASVTAALAAMPGDITGTGVHHIWIDAGTYTENVDTTKTGASATDYVFLHANPGNEHKLILGTGVIITAASGYTYTGGPYTKTENITIKTTGSGNILSHYGTTNRLYNVIFWATDDVLAATSCDYTTQFYKCLAVYTGVSASTGGGFNNQGFYYNCGCYGFFSCYNAAFNYSVENCWGICAAGGIAFRDASISIGSNNASNDATAFGTSSLINLSLPAFKFVNAAAYDFHIMNDSPLAGSGKDESSLYTTDADLLTINNWMMGPVTTLPVLPSLPAETKYVGDIDIFNDGSSFGATVNRNDLVRDSGMKTAILISLFTDRRATNEDELPDDSNNLHGWWADNLLGSKLWLLFRSKTIDEVVTSAGFYAQEALQWMIDDGVASNILCVATRNGNILNLSVQVTPPIGAGDIKTFAYYYNWQNQLFGVTT